MKKSLYLFLAAIAAVVCLGRSFAWAAPNADDQLKRAVQKLDLRAQEDNPETLATGYVIGAGNMLQIRIFGEAGVSQIYRVDEDGYVKHALAGRIKLGGLTVAEAERVLEKELDGDYIINPQVSVLVLEFSHFSIIGEVRKPGNYEISGRTTVLRAISIAGGFTPIANQKGVQIIRKNTDGSEKKISVDATRIMAGDLSAEVELQADDVVVISKSFF